MYNGRIKKKNNNKNKGLNQSVNRLQENICLKATVKVRHLPVDSTNGSRDLRLVSRLRTETTAALPGKDNLKNEKINFLRLCHFEPVVQGYANKTD